MASCGRWLDRHGASGELPTLLDVRDTVVDCLASIHGPQFSETRAALGLDAGDAAVRSSVQGIVRLAFQLCGGSYDAPTHDTLVKVINVLSERSLGWGVPADVIFEQHCVVMRCLGLMLMAEECDEGSIRQSH